MWGLFEGVVLGCCLGGAWVLSEGWDLNLKVWVGVGFGLGVFTGFVGIGDRKSVV